MADNSFLLDSCFSKFTGWLTNQYQTFESCTHFFQAFERYDFLGPKERKKHPVFVGIGFVWLSLSTCYALFSFAAAFACSSVWEIHRGLNQYFKTKMQSIIIERRRVFFQQEISRKNAHNQFGVHDLLELSRCILVVKTPTFIAWTLLPPTFFTYWETI